MTATPEVTLSSLLFKNRKGGATLLSKRWNRKRFLMLIVITILSVLSTTAGGYTPAARAETSPSPSATPAASPKASPSPAASAAPTKTTKTTSAVEEFEPYYLDVVQGWKKQNLKPATTKVEIPGTKITGQFDVKTVTSGSYQGKNPVLIWKSDDESWIEYQVQVEQDGLYEMNVNYLPYQEKQYRRPINWAITLDGKFPFREARSIQLYRQWQDVTPIKKDKNGDDIRPTAKDISTWTTAPVRDNEGAYEMPLNWYLTKGTHTMRITSTDPVAIASITFGPPTTVDTYANVSQKYPKSDSAGNKQPILIEAEQMTSKSESSIQMTSDSDVRSVPKAQNSITFNSVGGSRWNQGNQEITWAFEVPESGRYKLALRAYQSFTSNKASFRAFTIDGKIPFSELVSYRFPYATSWQGTVIGDDKGKAYEFYLEKGKHTLSMRSTGSPVKQYMIEMEKSMTVLRTIGEDIQALTGGQKDTSRTWKVDRDLPGVTEQLQGVVDKLKEVSVNLEKVNGRKDQISQGIGSSVKDLEKILKNKDEIPNERDSITRIETNIATYMQQIDLEPLQLDQIYFVPADQPVPSLEAPFFSKMKGMIVNFFQTFRSKDKLSDLDEEAINVWVSRGRDYVNLVQTLADEQFTPETGKKVKVNILPNAQMLVLMNAAGISPDIVLGMGQEQTFDFALRGGLVDISKFPDFQTVKDRFSPGTWLSYYYDHGYYGVPETQSFQVLYYRKDILSRLGLEVPQTWQDVYSMLPVLQQNNLNFYMPPKEFIPYFYQNGTNFYNTEGTKTGLASAEAFKSFKMWTDMFNIYALDKSVSSFYQHFRVGDYPIGLDNYGLYLQLINAAPELNGRWGTALIPGTPQADGTISRWVGGGLTNAAIFKSSKKQDEAWQFLKWWTSADTQERYGIDLETFNGPAFRWNTANVEAFAKLPWPKSDLNVILDQWRWIKEIPNVPGGYFMGREMNNAWTRTVVDGMNYRNSLEIATVEIEREVKRKEKEFGIVDDSGNVLRPLDIPVVNEPWKGVDKFVNK